APPPDEIVVRQLIGEQLRARRAHPARRDERRRGRRHLGTVHTLLHRVASLRLRIHAARVVYAAAGHGYCWRAQTFIPRNRQHARTTASGRLCRNSLPEQRRAPMSAAARANAARKAFAAQAEYCTKLGSHFTAALCETLIDVLSTDDEVGRRVLGWPG